MLRHLRYLHRVDRAHGVDRLALAARALEQRVQLVREECRREREDRHAALLGRDVLRRVRPLDRGEAGFGEEGGHVRAAFRELRGFGVQGWGL